MTFAVFHSVGSLPWSRDAWNRVVNIADVSDVVSFSRRAGISSGPSSSSSLSYRNSML